MRIEHAFKKTVVCIVSILTLGAEIALADMREEESKTKIDKSGSQSISQISTQSVSAIEDKMKKIIIDEIEFRQADMRDIVDFLNKRSRDCDKTTKDEARKGVTIVLNLNPGGTSPSKHSATPKPEASAGYDLSGIEVTFSARYISLYNTLKIITKVSGLKWFVDGDVVNIVPLNYEIPSGDRKSKRYAF